MMKRRTSNLSLRPEANVRDILELIDCKMFSRKLLKLCGIHKYSDSKGVKKLISSMFSLYFII